MTVQAPNFRGYITKKNAKSYDLTFKIWCTSRTHIRTFLRFHGFPESDRFCTFLIVKGNKHLIIIEIDGIDEGIHQCLPLLRLGHIQLTETEQPEPDEFFFHLRFCQPFFCNAGLQFLPLFFQRFQPLLGGTGQNAHLDSVQHIGDAVLLGICRTFTNLALNRFFALVVAGIASVDHGGHGKHLSFYIIERWSILSKHCFV